MSANRILDRLAHIARVSLAILTALPFSLGGTLTYATPPDKDKGRENEHEPETESPIKHVIVLIGENRTFDHVFATYVPKQGESVSNLLSK
jgi:phospholipase C